MVTKYVWKKRTSEQVLGLALQLRSVVLTIINNSSYIYTRNRS